MPASRVQFVARRHPKRPQLVEPAHTDPAGVAGPTPGEARGKHWRRTGPGLYVPSTVDPGNPEQRVLEAGRCLRGHGAVTGWAALHWMGATWLDGRAGGDARPVPLALGGYRRLLERPGLSISREGLAPHEVIEWDLLAVTTPARSALFEMRYAPSVREAVVVLDMAAAADLVSVREAVAYANGERALAGIPQAREAAALAVDNSWSPQETRLRLTWVLDAGLPQPRCNAPVFDRYGRHVATPDLLDAAAGLAVEYDGDVHLHREQRAKDVEREHAMRELGLEVVTFVGRDMRSRRRAVERLLAARARARWEGEPMRRWSIDPPAWWTPRETVAERRALSDGRPPGPGPGSPLEIRRMGPITRQEPSGLSGRGG